MYLEGDRGHNEIHLKVGDSLTITLPSMSQINVEATLGCANISNDEGCLYSEEILDGDETFTGIWPRKYK